MRMRVELRDDHGRTKHHDTLVVSREYPGLGANEKVNDDEPRFLELNLN